MFAASFNRLIASPPVEVEAVVRVVVFTSSVSAVPTLPMPVPAVSDTDDAITSATLLFAVSSIDPDADNVATLSLVTLPVIVIEPLDAVIVMSFVEFTPLSD